MKSLKFKKLRSKTAIFLIVIISLLTIVLRMGAIDIDHQHGIPDWHPDSGRYFAQEKMYIRGSYKPYGHGPLYTGNPYANILFLSWIWRAFNRVSIYTGHGPISTDSIFLSKIGRAFYLFLSVVVVIVLFLISRHIFHSNLIAALASFFFAVSPLAIGLNHTIKPELPMTCFITLSACFILLIFEKKKFQYYIFAGIFAGIATAIKYNGSIVMLYLIIVHTYKVFKNYDKRSFFKKITYALFSPYLFMSFLLCALFFYASEPILWHDLPKGIYQIRQYLNVTALWLLPKRLHGNHLGIILHNLVHIPQNIHVFLRAANVFFAFLAVAGLFLSKKYFSRKILVISLFPFILLVVLFLSKAMLGEEYLLHPLPFLYIFSALGFYSIIERTKPLIVKKSFTIFAMTSIIIYGLYMGFYEVKYFSLGAIPYHTQIWANKNLKTQCIKTHRGTIGSPALCKKHISPPIFSSRKSGLASNHANILLKTFCFEGKKPLLHHLRGHKIHIYAKKGKDFYQIPAIPRCSVPHLPVMETHFVRFLNGINFDPGYNAFYLKPFREYEWLLVSKSKIKSINCLLINSNIANNIRININNKGIELLPFEKKTIKMPLTSSFPWRSPYLYNFKIHTHRGYILLKLIDTYKDNGGLTTKLNPSSHFEKYFKDTYHYNFKYLEPLLEKVIPLKQVKNFETLDPLIAVKAFKDFCALNTHPIFLEKGSYICEITTQISIGQNSCVHFYLLSLPDTLAHKSYTKQDLSRYKTDLHFTYKITLPFKTKRDTMLTFLATHQGKTLENISKVTLKTNFYKMEKEKSECELVSRFLSTRQLSLNEKLDVINPESIDSIRAFKIGNAYFKNHDYKRAEQWFKTACLKNPIDRTYLILLSKLYKKTGDEKNTNDIEQRLIALKKFNYGPLRFETGLTLNACLVPRVAQREQLIPIRIYMTLPNISRDQSIFLSFEKDGNFYFGKDFSLFDSKPTGELRYMNGTIQIPPNIPSGTYNVYFTFRIPRIDYRYHILKKGGILPEKKIFVGKIKIIDK